MRILLFGLAGVLLAAAAMTVAIRLDGRGSSTMSAAELLIEARTRVVEAAPGEVVIIESREFHRGSGQIQRYFSNEFVQVPNETITTTWLLIGNEPGTIAMKHLVQRDLEGNVVQEEFYDGVNDYVYLALVGRMLVLPQDTVWRFSLSKDIDAILTENANEAVYLGETRINDRAVHLIELRRVGPGRGSGAAETTNAYFGYDIRDLDVQEFVTRITLDVDDFSLVQRETVTVDANGVETRLGSRTVDDVSISAVSALPEDTFSLQYVPQDILERDGSR